MLEQLQLSGGSTLSADTVLAIVQGPSERDIVYSGLVSYILCSAAALCYALVNVSIAYFLK